MNFIKRLIDSLAKNDGKLRIYAMILEGGEKHEHRFVKLEAAYSLEDAFAQARKKLGGIVPGVDSMSLSLVVWEIVEAEELLRPYAVESGTSMAGVEKASSSLKIVNQAVNTPLPPPERVKTAEELKNEIMQKVLAHPELLEENKTALTSMEYKYLKGRIKNSEPKK